jgi:hypothetical protein
LRHDKHQKNCDGSVLDTNAERADYKTGNTACCPAPVAVGATQDPDWFPIGDGRSGSGLGATAGNPSVNTGLHFGHHKAASPQPDEQAGIAAQFNRQRAAPSGNQTGGSGMASDLLTYFPPLDTFQSSTMDI